MTDSIWNRTMTREGYTATPEQQAQAWKAWQPNTGYMGLSRQLRIAGAEQAGMGSGSYRLADAMMQKARRAGIAKYDRKTGWSKVEETTDG